MLSIGNQYLIVQLRIELTIPQKEKSAFLGEIQLLSK